MMAFVACIKGLKGGKTFFFFFFFFFLSFSPFYCARRLKKNEG